MLCKNMDSLRRYLPAVINSEYAKYEAEVSEANHWIRGEILGSALYETINGEQFADDELLYLCEAVVARKAYMEGIPSFDLAETSSGFVVSRNEQQAPASPERVQKLRESIALRLTDSIERLLQYLEQHPDYHDQWKGSPVYAMLTDTFIHTLTEFRRYAPFPGSRMEYIDAKPRMLEVIRLRIEPVISRELSDEIIEQLRDDDLSQANSRIIGDLKFAYANYVAGQTEKANTFLYKVRGRLNAQAEDYPAWESSAVYAAYNASTVDKYNKGRPVFRAGF